MAEQVSRAVKLCGTEEVDPPSRVLGTGALSAELQNGQLRYIKIGDVEVLLQSASTTLFSASGPAYFGSTATEAKPDRIEVPHSTISVIFDGIDAKYSDQQIVKLIPQHVYPRRHFR